MAKRQKTVVITGASAGVGRATAREFAKHGSYVALLSRGEAGLQAAQAEVEALGGRALILPVDLANPEQIDKAAVTVEEELEGRTPPSSRITCRIFVGESDHRKQDFSRPSRSVPRAAWLRRAADGRTCRSQSFKQPLDAASEGLRGPWPIRRS